MNILNTPELRLQAPDLHQPRPAPVLGNGVPWNIVGNTLMTSGQFPTSKVLDGASDLFVEILAEHARHTRMIGGCPVMPMDGFCLAYRLAEIEAQ
ncbi:hypothetical protein JTY93_12950 [Pseudomonas hygromyciniae]|uniref:Endoribonuclease L-PSP/chorismate mutase-like domain-containing protein n=1 Tax=Pseudomonas hygromyciniae TaxID=2812000 RepID=A0ABX7K875_9PSED|nr:Atu1372/SO_1960 family protein [Pseudomonas hygromyciniae]MBN0979484.1 hypothetical protein [Pseudomonas hygromyciniae]QSB42156.1 hypothetical protein JTY93_12950 [Pseudomonas hygromyciniae]